MKLLGYIPISNFKKNNINADIFNYKENNSSFAKWIEPYAKYDYVKEIL